VRLFLLLVSLTAWAADNPLLRRDPGPIKSLDLAAGPGGKANAPQGPFSFVQKETRGTAPKAVVVDARQRKWMKSENFASRLAWALGYPVRASYYVTSGSISGVPDGTLTEFVNPDGTFKGGRFQMFDNARFQQVDGLKLDLAERHEDQSELNGLKLMLLLVSNWDVKPANSAVFEVEGKRYVTISDWGASLGDPAAGEAERKWNCPAFKRQTGRLIEGVENGYIQINYMQYAARHEGALSLGISTQDLKSFVDRSSGLSDRQLKAGLLASGATAGEAQCFTQAIRERLNLFASTSNGQQTSHTPRTITTTKTTTTTIRK
jgi:hypothetical protein